MVRMTPALGVALVLGSVMGLGAWLLVSLVPIFRRPRLAYRVAPYVLDVSAEARELLSRRRVQPGRIVGVVASPVSERLAPVVAMLLGSPELLKRRLRQANSTLTVSEVRGQQLVWALVGALGGIVVGVAAALGGAPIALAPVLAIVLGLSGAALRDWLIQRQAKQRLKRISSELPTVLEFLTLSLSAGEGLGDALRRLATVSSGELAGEFHRIVSRAAAGERLVEALEATAVELHHPGVTRAVEQMRGAIERGTPLAATLRAQASDARSAAKRDLLEAAGRKEISMLLPLVFGLLPATVIFALWPGVYVLQVGF